MRYMVFSPNRGPFRRSFIGPGKISVVEWISAEVKLGSSCKLPAARPLILGIPHQRDPVELDHGCRRSSDQSRGLGLAEGYHATRNCLSDAKAVAAKGVRKVARVARPLCIVIARQLVALVWSARGNVGQVTRCSISACDIMTVPVKRRRRPRPRTRQHRGGIQP